MPGGLRAGSAAAGRGGRGRRRAQCNDCVRGFRKLPDGGRFGMARARGAGGVMDYCSDRHSSRRPVIDGLVFHLSRPIIGRGCCFDYGKVDEQNRTGVGLCAEWSASVCCTAALEIIINGRDRQVKDEPVCGFLVDSIPGLFE